ncbi:MAG: cytochrome P450 [Mesorhizobium sp.]
MVKLKYFDKIHDAQRAELPASKLPPFDLGRLRTGRGFVSRIVSKFLENPRWWLSLLRRGRPLLRVGRFMLVTRNDDVRDILERQDEFQTPYGPEMTEIAGGTNFILGMQDGADYRRMKSAVLSAFPPDEVETIVRPIAARHSQAIMTRAEPGFDAISGLLKVVPVNICRDYFGIVVDDDVKFAEWSIALSALFFSDPFGNPATREVAVVAADRMVGVIDRSIEAVRDGRTNPNAPLARLVAMLDRKRLTLNDIHSIMMGMIAGFGPTNLLAGGNCLDVLMSKPEARAALEQAFADNDEKQVQKTIMEAMRFKPIWIGPVRYTARDALIAEGTRRERVIKKGTIVMPATLSAMFDPEAVHRPDDFDTTRPCRDYMVFGHGIHLCIGSAVAQVQIAESFRALFAKPDLRRAKGAAGKMRRLGAYPESLKVDFERSPLCQTVTHSMVTVVCPLRPSVSVDRIRDGIASLGNPAGVDMKAALDATGVIHFASIAVSSPEGAEPEDTHLVIEISGDGTEASVIDAFANHTDPLLGGIIREACDFAGQTLAGFMRKHAVKISPSFGSSAGLVFSGTPGLSVERIRAEAKLAEKVQKIVEGPGNETRSAAATLAEVRRKIAKDPKSAWVLEPAENLLDKPEGSLWQAALTTLKAPPMAAAVVVLVLASWWLTYNFAFDPHDGFFHYLFRVGASLLLALGGLALLFFVPLLICFIALRRLEKRDKPSEKMIELSRFEAINEREDHAAQNHLTAISIMKPGRLRRLTLRLAFYLISISAQKVFRPGYLSNINTIHFARWISIPGTNQLMFFSNYGGSWESYLEDFITKAANGLTGVWSNTIGFPVTSRLFGAGARDGERFKRWARTQQVPTLFWYAAYPHVNTARIRINSKIRYGIAHATANQARDWISLFGSLPRPLIAKDSARINLVDAAPPPIETLELGEIQTIFFNAFGPLEYGAMLAIRIPESASRRKRKAWLEFIAERTSFGDRVLTDQAMTVAFGPDGLRRLGLDCDPDHDPMENFALSFRLGMSSASRARILDDVGDSAPEKWQWGSARNPVDAVVVCYATSKEKLKSDVSDLQKRLKAAGMELAAQLPLFVNRNGKRAREHFGFVDGISQPIVRGTARANSSVSPLHLVAPGEFLFGYRDEHGYFPPAVTTSAAQDRDGILPTLNEMNSMGGETGLHDFGRNGSFLVVRQFEQHVGEFENFCQMAARGHEDPEITPRWIAAKMIGRWPDGSSLVRNPDGRTGRPIDNDFTFGAEDPQGLLCPLGSHIRRSNPRDSLGDDHQIQLHIGKRHRILRVGRPYEKKKEEDAESEKGLLFMCLNADIERQYEFMQQTWVSSGSFHGLIKEKDPTIGTQDEKNGGGRFSIPRWEGTMVLKGIPNFVTTRGGGYFFMPSRSALRYLISRL